MKAEAGPVVATNKGSIEGTQEEGLYVFRGIPYAAPPVGDLRWMPPKAYPAWKGIRTAKQYGAITPQNIMPPGITGDAEPEPQSEDCLFLNIYTPGLDKPDRPVMVWIHGGAFSIGSGSSAMYRSGSIAKRGNVVLVTLNYRLGALGFLNLNELTGGEIPATGNEGLLDQIAALEWVKSNITAFGGDPENVTIFGESAGAMSIACLMCMPKAQGLFHKAIIESPVGAIARPLNSALRTAEVFLKTVNLKATEVEALRSLPVAKILAAQNKVAIETGQGGAPCIPVADGRILPSMPLETFAAGQAAPVPTLVGSNQDEQKFFSLMEPGGLKITDQEVKNRIGQMIEPEKSAAVIEEYRRLRLQKGLPVNPIDIYSAINSDLRFRLIAIHIASYQHRNGVPAYHYLFNWKSPAAGGILGACHVLEVGFVFGTCDEKFHGKGQQADLLRAQMQDAWTAFACKGNPSTQSMGKWLKYGQARNTMVIGENCHMEVKNQEEERLVWETAGVVDLNKMP